MSDKQAADKSDPAKAPAAAKEEAAKASPAHASKEDPAHTPKEAPTAAERAKITQADLVVEGVKAADSHRQTTRDVVEADREPLKAPKPHPHVGKMTKLRDEVAELSKRHKEEVLDLRDKLQTLLYDAPGDIPLHSMNAVHSVATQIEEGINMLDPDCSARAPS